jgi:hypothetical protein
MLTSVRRAGVFAWPTALALLLRCVLFSAPAFAEATATAGTSGAREAERTQIYSKAVELANAGRWDDAARMLRQVLDIRSSPKVRFTLGQAEEHAGRLSAAFDAYGQTLIDANVAGVTDVAGNAERALRAVQPRVPVVRVLVTGVGAGEATVTLDEHPTPQRQPTRVDPGSHRVAVNAPGARSATTTIAIGEGQHLDVPVHLDAQDAPVTASAPEVALSPSPTRFNPWPTVGLVTASAGLVALGIGSYFGAVAISDNNTSNSTGCKGNNCTAGAFAERQDAQSAASASTALFIVGGVLAAGGVATWAVSRRQGSSVSVAPSPVARGVGVIAVGAWQ